MLTAFAQNFGYTALTNNCMKATGGPLFFSLFDRMAAWGTETSTSDIGICDAQLLINNRNSSWMQLGPLFLNLRPLLAFLAFFYYRLAPSSWILIANGIVARYSNFYVPSICVSRATWHDEFQELLAQVTLQRLGRDFLSRQIFFVERVIESYLEFSFLVITPHPCTGSLPPRVAGNRYKTWFSHLRSTFKIGSRWRSLLAQHMLPHHCKTELCLSLSRHVPSKLVTVQHYLIHIP